MDRVAEKILVLVAANGGVNPPRREHKVFLGMIVGEELAGPKQGANHYPAKGKPVNIQVPSR